MIAVLAGWAFPASLVGKAPTLADDPALGMPGSQATPQPAGGSSAHQAPSNPALAQEPAPENPSLPPDMARRQKKDLLKSNFAKMKSDADELLELSKSLQADLDKSNENVLSLRVVDRAEKIEKLAKKIKELARGY
jgi:hypothetical protein